MRQAIAEHMVASRRTAAHCTTVVEADFSAVARSRRARKDELQRRGVPLTYLAFVAASRDRRRCASTRCSTRRSRATRSSTTRTSTSASRWRSSDGLVVPVIRKAQRLSLEGLAAAIGELATRARDGGLTPDDVAGGTFTITNPGQFGALIATPIINQPQVAILDLEAIVRRPVGRRRGRQRVDRRSGRCRTCACPGITGRSTARGGALPRRRPCPDRERGAGMSGFEEIVVERGERVRG